VVSTSDSDSGNPGSTPGRTYVFVVSSSKIDSKLNRRSFYLCQF
jgi:hypothetical protein